MSMKKSIIFYLVVGMLTLTTLFLSFIFFRPAQESLSFRRDVGSVEVYETTGNKSRLMARQNDLFFSIEGRANTTITVNPHIQYQAMDGFGAGLTHASAYLIKNSEFKDEMLMDLFHPTLGAGFNVLRIPIGSSDFPNYTNGELVHFTLNDTENNQPDLTLSNFNIYQDLLEIIPLLHEIKVLNPNLQLVAAPWSPPAWMKTTNSLNSGSLRNEYEELYAEYLFKFVEAYHNEGITIDLISIQNEPYHGTANYPVNFMDYDQAIRVSIYLGRMLRESGLNTMIMGWDHNTDVPEYGIYLLDDEEARKYIAGTAFHGYYGNTYDLEYAYALVKEAHPDKKIYFTEITAGGWSVDFALNLSHAMENFIQGSINNHSTMVLYWNLVLDESYGPRLGGCSNCVGLFTLSNDDLWYSRSSEYYALAHISKFVRLDLGEAKRIEVDSSNQMVVASGFMRADGKLVVVATNLGDRFSEDIEIVFAGQRITYTLSPQSTATFVW